MSAKKKVIVIGGGPAGMMAAITAAEGGMDVTLMEQNKDIGRKLLISGKGRCNVTNYCDRLTFLENMVGNGKFLQSAYQNFTSADAMSFFEEAGVALKVERGSRVFPVSDCSADIVNALIEQMKKAGVKICCRKMVDDVFSEDGHVGGVEVDGKLISADAVVIATGGLSYPRTGALGDGYGFAENLGHTVTDLFPSLVPLVVKEPFVAELEGLSLRNVLVTLKKDRKNMDQRFGEMIFTANGVSGPVILSMSRNVALYFLKNKEPLQLMIDFKPALDAKQLDVRLQRDLTDFRRKSYQHIAYELLPKRLVPVFLRLAEVNPVKKGSEINRHERARVRDLLKCFPLMVTACGDIEDAIVTGGGVSVTEIKPNTMMSKRVDGVFFAGEVMDVDGYTGGFNIHTALCTGVQAGKGIIEYLK